MDSTISKSVRHASTPRDEQAACLCVALCCDRPLERPARHDIRHANVVTIGRAPRSEPPPSDAAPGRHLAIPIDDPRMSSSHVRLVHLHGHWVLEDLRSKNGVLLNDRRVSTARLKDGDVLEIGHTLLLFRTGGVTAGPRDSPSGGARRAPHEDLETIVPALADDFHALARVAASSAPILVVGETGSGKELVSRAVHDLSQRRGSFVPVNCAAIPPSLVESELFGVRRGAYSGATESRMGLVRASGGGTLFLDEVGDLAAGSQAALLRTLSEGEVLPVGETRAERVDLRVLCATHRDLDAMVARGEFRPDLLGRLAGFRIRLPPLRERREDIGLLIARMLPRVAGDRAPRVRLTCAAGYALLRHRWPLNIRELEKVLTVAVALARDRVIEVEHLPAHFASGDEEPHAPHSAEPLHPEDAALRSRLVGLLSEHRGNVAGVARALGKARMQIHRWMKRYGISASSFRP